MKANELRIGNLLYYHSTNLVGTVSLISEFVFDCRNEIGSFTPNCKYDPIPLTEEILLKCGFEKKNGGWHMMNLINVWTFIFYHPIHGVAELSINKHGAILSDQCKYLHQLQNLYFALSGEELEVKI